MIPGSKTLIAMAAIAFLSFSAGIGFGWKIVGYPRGHADGVKAAQTINDALNTVAVDTMRGKQQCVAEVEKVNVENERQKEENRKILIDDREATRLAVERAEAAATNAAISMNKTQIQIAEARNEIGKIKDACVSAGVPAALFDVLNRAVETQAPAIRSAPSGGLPGAAAGN